MSEIRFHLDECVLGAVADGLRQRGIDVSTTPEQSLLGEEDPRQLTHAVRHGRVLVTQDADFLRLHAEGVLHKGIVYYAPGSRSVGEIVSHLDLIHKVISAEELDGQLEWI